MSAQVPDLMRIGAIDTEMAQDVQTVITDPVVFDQNTCRITLQNIGFLHSMSRITFQVATATATNAINGSNANATYPIGVGVHSLIQRATLTIGGKTICELEDFAHWMGYKSMFIANEINKERESVLSGRIINHEPVYFDDFNASSYRIANSTDSLDTIAAPAGAFKATAITSASATLSSGTQPADNLLVRNEPELQVALADLFPFLRFNQLPLYMMKEQVSINLVFTPVTATAGGIAGSQHRICGQATAPATDQTFAIKTGSVKLIADYLTFDGEIMAQYAAANQEMNWNYVDYRLTKRTYNGSSTIPQTQQILNVGGAGRIVNKMFCSMNNDNKLMSADPLNVYSSVNPGITATGNIQILTTNVRYNDEYLYPIDRTNPAIQFHDIVQTEAQVPHITRDEYNSEGGGTAGGGLTVELYNGHACTTLRGQFCHQAHRLNRNERINSRGIELETTYSELPGLTTILNYTQRVWIEVLRTATLRNGMFDCYYA
tara:strand:- start:5798 stop:7273 length:1476 start_codon:yes stop_codon:yes gene_type:complete